MLHVYYKEKTGMRYRTDIRFGAADFICKNFLSEFVLKNQKGNPLKNLL
jgi:hypothetical protein